MKTLILLFALASHGYAGQLSSSYPGLVSLWHLNDGTGTAAVDAKGVQNGASFSGAWTDNYFGKGITLTAANTFVSVAHNAVYNIAHPTVMIWVYQTGTSIQAYQTAGAFIKDYNGKVPFYLGALSSEGTGFHYYTGAWHSAVLGRDLGGGVYQVSKWRFPINRWLFLVGTYDGATLKFYVNGLLEGSTVDATAIQYNTNNIDIGEAGWADYFFQGRLDEAALFNRALTQGEIQRIYTEGLGRHSNVR